MSVDLGGAVIAMDIGAYCRIGDTGFGQVWMGGDMIGVVSREVVRQIQASEKFEVVELGPPRARRRCLVKRKSVARQVLGRRRLLRRGEGPG